jgi:hypothetical protein
MNDELPAWVTYFNSSVAAYTSSLKGPDNGSLDTDVWNVYDWELN